MDSVIEDKTCCFFGHRKIKEIKRIKNKLYFIIEKLIVNEKVDTFLFGSKSEFDLLCLETITELKEKYRHIKRIYVRSSYQYIDENYKKYILESYEDTYYPKQIENSGKASYVERNREMINNSKFCVIYYDAFYVPPKRRKANSAICDYQPKSGTRLAYEYAIKKEKTIINTFDEILQ